VDNKSREYEEQHFIETVAFAKVQAESASEKLSVLDKQITQMKSRFNNDNFDLYSQIIVALDKQKGLSDLVNRCNRAVNQPYFGRIDFAEKEKETKTFYIGRSGLYDDVLRSMLVIDWRTPLANLYYEADMGQASYQSVEDTISGFMSLKRTYSISEGRLEDYYDSDMVTNDQLLQAYLAKNADAVLRDIVATIQKDQNDIIRIKPYFNVIVQGVAGSGKTTVAMHRLAYLIFNYSQYMSSDQYAVIGTNRMFLSYVSGMLPDLGVESVTQMVMPELFETYLRYDHSTVPLDSKTAPTRSSLSFFEELREYLDRQEQALMLHELTLGGEVLLSEKDIKELFLGGLNKPLLTRAEMLNEYLADKVKRKKTELELLYEKNCDQAVAQFKKGITGSYYSVGEIIDDKYVRLKRLAAEAKALKNIYIKKIKSLTEEKVYLSFLKVRGLKKPKQWDVYDLAALSYIASRLRPMSHPLRHIIIDEAQDFGPMIYKCITEIYPSASFTILGDVLQNIGEGIGITDWTEVLGTAFRKENTRFCVLSKSYRNTVEIAETANRLISGSGVAEYEVVPVVRHGKPVEFSEFPSYKELEAAAVAEALRWKKGSLALICPDTARAKSLAEKIPGCGLILSDEENSHYEGGITVFDSMSVKGLEFDRVVVCGAGIADYPAEPRTTRLLYVVLTRALHELSILTVKGSGGLLN
jgi:DNA helicase-2/ATP-dependent DNA helicase PcrA